MEASGLCLTFKWLLSSEGGLGQPVYTDHSFSLLKSNRDRPLSLYGSSHRDSRLSTTHSITTHTDWQINLRWQKPADCWVCTVWTQNGVQVRENKSSKEFMKLWFQVACLPLFRCGLATGELAGVNRPGPISLQRSTTCFLEDSRPQGCQLYPHTSYQIPATPAPRYRRVRQTLVNADSQNISVWNIQHVLYSEFNLILVKIALVLFICGMPSIFYVHFNNIINYIWTMCGM